MKNNTFKKWLLPISASAVVALPFVGVISCNSNNDHTNNEQNPDNNGENQTPNPIPTKEILNHTNTFEYKKEDGIVDEPNLLLNFDQWKQKILNNQIKWFNDDGSAIIYEINIDIEPGLINSPSEYADVNAPQNFEPANRPENYWKKIDKPINLKWEFWKKQNNDSYAENAFSSKVISESPYGLGVLENANTAKMRFAFPMDTNIAVAMASGDNIDKSRLNRIIWLGIESHSRTTGKEGQIILTSMTQENYEPTKNPWSKIKHKFNSIDGYNTNLVVYGLKNSTLKSGGNGLNYSNVKGKLTIKPKNI